MSRLFIYLRNFDPSLGGPFFSTLDMAQLVDGHLAVTLVTRDGTADITERLTAFGLDAKQHMNIRRFLAGGHLRSQDVLHVQHVFDPLAALVARKARYKGMRVVLSPRGALDDWSMRRRKWKKWPVSKVLNPLYWSKASLLHCTAQAEADQVAAVVSKVPVSVVPNVIPSAWGRPERENVGQRSALFLSRLHEKKRPDLAIAGAAPLLRSGQLDLLTMAGSGEPEYVASLRALAVQHRVAEKVSFVGHLGPDERDEAYANHRLFILPTSQENFGRVLFEALASGLAVFVPDTVDTWPELCRLGALRIEQNADNIASALGSYLARPETQRYQAVTDSQRLTAEYLSKSQLLASYLRMYESAGRNK